VRFGVFWDILSCSQIDVDRRFKGAYGLHHVGDERDLESSGMYCRVVEKMEIALMMDAVRPSETSVNICLTTRQYIPEDSKLDIAFSTGTNEYVLPLSH
jgi:hypothetical protein